MISTNTYLKNSENKDVIVSEGDRIVYEHGDVTDEFNWHNEGTIDEISPDGNYIKFKDECHWNKSERIILLEKLKPRNKLFGLF